MLQQQLTDHDLDDIYEWVDSLTLSRPKKNINRDFSDALMMAEIIHHYFPKLVDLHNYPGTNSFQSKWQNWKTLNSKVLSKVGLQLTNEQCKKIASATPNYIEVLLHEFKKICRHHEMGSSDRKIQVQQRDSFRGKENEKQLSHSSRVEELREILSLLKEKITSTERIISRKDAQIKELEDMLNT